MAPFKTARHGTGNWSHNENIGTLSNTDKTLGTGFNEAANIART
jgi:hypothetical protein